MTFVLKAIFSLLIMVGSAAAASAQIVPGRETHYDVSDTSSTVLPQTCFKPSQLIAPGVLIASGTLVHCFAHNSIDKYVQERVLAWRGPSGQKTIDDYVQYLPFICAAGLGLTGVESRHPLGGRLIVIGYTAASFFVVTKLMKEIIYSPRPDGTANNSFPSGHTGTAFAGAEYVRMEYGWGWGAGAYAMASMIAFMRIHNNRHWFSDTLAGAGVGILCAHVGEWLLEPTMRLFKREVAIVPSLDPYTGSFGAALAFNF